MAEGGVLLYTCDLCGQDGLSDDEMRTHVLLEHVEKSITCPFCDLQGTTLEEMTFHINNVHPDFTTPSIESKGFPQLLMSKGGEQVNGSDLESNKEGSQGGSGDRDSGSGSEIAMETSDESPSMNSISRDSTCSFNSVSQDPNEVAPIEMTVVNLNSAHASPSKQSFSDRDEKLMENLDSQEQHKKRAKLHLNVPQVHVSDKPALTEKVLNIKNRSKEKCIKLDTSLPQTSRLTCPMCSWSCLASDEMEIHVNRAHLDALTPSKPRHANDLNANPKSRIASTNHHDPLPSTSKAQYLCPICGLQAQNGAEIEQHVNTSHVDILSPESNANTAGAPLAVPEDTHNIGIACPVCAMEFTTNESLNVHVNGHFSAGPSPALEVMDSLVAQELERREKAAAKLREQKEFEKLQALYGMSSNKNTYRKQAEKNLERAVVNGQLSISDYYSQRLQTHQAQQTGVDDGHSCTKGILSKLRQYYKGNPANIRYVWLCTSVDHFASSYGDKGWGCGYRNLQMLLSSLATCPNYERVLFNGRPFIPSIPKIQRLIEAAWQKGFDPQGKEQLGNSIINTTKWIGATEIVATLSSLKVKCQLVDFHAATRRDGTHPRLLEWVRDYFRKPGDYKAPLYLQHQGHSRTIIGIEEMKDNSLRLLIFDPGCSKRQMQHFQTGVDGNLMRSIRRTLQGLKARQYQIVAVIGTLSERDYESSKVIRSERIP